MGFMFKCGKTRSEFQYLYLFREEEERKEKAMEHSGNENGLDIRGKSFRRMTMKSYGAEFH